MGLDTDLFLCDADTLSVYVCAICTDVSHPPVLSPCVAGHMFCAGCVATSPSVPRLQACPLDREPLRGRQMQPLTGGLLRVYNTFKLKCSQGCEWTGPIDSLTSHLSQHCRLSEVPCAHAGCSYRCARETMQAHAASCNYMTVTCGRCKKQFTASMLSMHYCPNMEGGIDVTFQFGLRQESSMVPSSLTLYELKLKVMEIFDVMPQNQKLLNLALEPSTKHQDSTTLAGLRWPAKHTIIVMNTTSSSSSLMSDGGDDFAAPSRNLGAYIRKAPSQIARLHLLHHYVNEVVATIAQCDTKSIRLTSLQMDQTQEFLTQTLLHLDALDEEGLRALRRDEIKRVVASQERIDSMRYPPPLCALTLLASLPLAPTPPAACPPAQRIKPCR
eukprot:TRINITY_DN2805_c0_g2_i1.p1 TRINITY_DN2805_c0_g2~~TRINITY_DN2805_c0_g2_i1.p1  ORF type:complete len:395 (+),score=42.41 TRINITY_DN2805_c0_g2_i1:29-1186(+)